MSSSTFFDAEKISKKFIVLDVTVASFTAHKYLRWIIVLFLQYLQYLQHSHSLQYLQSLIVYYVPRRIMRVITRRPRRAKMLAGDRSRGAISPASILSESRNYPNCVHWRIFYFMWLRRIYEFTLYRNRRMRSSMFTLCSAVSQYTTLRYSQL